MLISYTKADYEFIANAYPRLKAGLDEVLSKNKIHIWFRNQRPELLEEMQRKLRNRWQQQDSKSTATKAK